MFYGSFNVLSKFQGRLKSVSKGVFREFQRYLREIQSLRGVSSEIEDCFIGVLSGC